MRTFSGFIRVAACANSIAEAAWGVLGPCHRTTRIQLIGLLVALLTIGGCDGQLLGRTFDTTLVDPINGVALPIRLGDTTGKVVRIEPDLQDHAGADDPTVAASSSDPNAFVVSWIGSMCDADVVMNFWPRERGYALQVHVNGKPGLGCPAAGIPRAVRVTMSEPFVVDTVSVVGGV
jgi:hypothetical protein